MMGISVTTLKSLLTFSRDGEWGKSDPFDGSVKMRVIRGTDFEDVSEGKLENLPVRYIARRFAEYKALQQNDIIIETAGGSKNRPTGRILFVKPSLISKSDLPLTCASFARFLRIDAQKAYPAYLFLHLQNMYDTGYLLQYHTQHTGVARFQYTVFAENEPLKLPPLDTQRKISAVLSAYDDLIENNTRRMAILEEMAQALYREWFVRGQVPGTLEMGNGRLPEGWQVLTLGDVCESVRYGYTAKAKHEPVGPKFLRITDIVPNLIDWDSVPHCEIPEKDIAKFLLQEGDVVIARTGATVGYAKRIGKRQPKTIFASYLVCMRPAKNYSQFILGLVVESSEYKEFIRSNCGGAAQPSANAELMKSYPVIVPSPQIQSQFDALVAPMFEQREVLQHKNANLRQTRDLLLPRLISGELDISQLDIALPS